MVKEKPRQYKAELESFKSFTHRVRDLVQYSEYLPGDFHYYEEKLYRKRNGEFFLYGEGGPASKYGEFFGNMYRDGSAIVPITEEEAKQWAECALAVGDYEELFGEVEE